MAQNLPLHDVTIVAPAATLVARKDLHPALIQLLLQAAVEVHRSGDLLADAGTFPSAELVAFPVSADAERYLRSGPSFLRRYLPFWIANLIDRLWILIIPIITIMIPLIRIAPPAYRWRIRRKIYRWYRDLRRIEGQLRLAEDAEARAAELAQLDRLQAEVGRIEVPLAYADNLYHLRLHIRFVKMHYE